MGVSDRFYHEIRSVSDVGRGAKKNGTDADGHEVQPVGGQQVSHVTRAACSEKRAEKTQIRRGIIKHAGKYPRTKIKNRR